MNIKDKENEDLSYEKSEEIEYEDSLEGKVKKLKDQLEVAKKEKDDYLLNWQRERADFINYKKDEDARRIGYIMIAKERTLSELLGVLDAFDMAFQNKETWEKVDKNWRIGVEYIYQKLLQIFTENGVDAFGAVGEVFDPMFHQSIETMETKEKERDHTIAKVTQRGYKMNDKILRPATVSVWSYKEE